MITITNEINNNLPNNLIKFGKVDIIYCNAKQKINNENKIKNIPMIE